MTIQSRTTIPKEMTVERISDLETFLSLEAEWDALLKASGQQNVYLPHHWIAGWIRFFGEKMHLWFLVVKSRGRWMGVAPLVQSVQHWRGLPVRILHFPVSFASANLRCDFILSEPREEAVLAVARYLKERAGEWDRWELSGLPADSPVVPLLRRFLERPFFYTTPQPQHDYYYLPISGSFEEYLNNKSVRFNKTLRNRENRLRRVGMVTYRTLKSQEEMIRLEGGIRQFYRYLAETFGKSGDGQIDLLEIDGIAVAALFSLQIEGSLFLLYTCYDPSAAFVSPGLLLLRKVFENAWPQGFREIDFNGWTPNVLIWADRRRQFLKGNVYNGTLRSRLVRFWEWTASTSLRRALKRAAVGPKGSASTSLFQDKDRSSRDHSQEDLKGLEF